MKFRCFSILYNSLLALYGLFSLPSLLNKHKRKTTLKKWGRGFNFITDRPIVWIHAVSLGETKAITPLALEIKKSYPEIFLLITSTTETGHAEAKKKISIADAWEFLPFDFSWIIRPIMQRLKPKILLFSESDLWPHLIQSAKQEGAYIAVVNGKISERSADRMRKLAPLLSYIFAPCDLLAMQSTYYKTRFQSLGVPEEKLHVTGNLKLDTLSAPEIASDLNIRLGLSADDLVLVAGSTHAGEEELMIKLYQKLSNDFPKLKLLLVPRHPERFQEVKKILENYNIASSTYSNPTNNAKIILIDEMGLLKSCYQRSTISIVCGSFTPKVGGHNIIEPCQFGKPVLFGPFMHTQTEFVRMVKEYEAGLQVDENGIETLIRSLLVDKQKRHEMGLKGIQLIQEAQGATQRTFSLLKEHFFNFLNLSIADNSAKG